MLLKENERTYNAVAMKNSLWLSSVVEKRFLFNFSFYLEVRSDKF